MYRLNCIWDIVVGTLIKENGGVIALKSKEEYEILSKSGLKDGDKIKVLLNEEIVVGKYKTDQRPLHELLTGTLSVQKSGIAAFREALPPLYCLISENTGVEDFLKHEGTRIRSIMIDSIKAKKYRSMRADNAVYKVKSSVIEDIECSTYDLDKLDRLLCEILKEHFSDVIRREDDCEIKWYRETMEIQNAWEFLAWIIYVSFISMNYMDARRDKNEISKNIELIKNFLHEPESKKRLEKKVVNRKVSAANDNEFELKTFSAMMYEFGRTAIDICEELVDNDNALYQLGIGHKNEGTPELWARFLESNPETFLFVVRNEKIVGNYSFVAIDEEQVQQLMQGKLYESDFSIEKNTAIFAEGIYTLYLLNFSMNVGFNTVQNLRMLWSALMNQLEKYAEQGIFFDRIFVNAFRIDHQELYKQLGFQYLLKNDSAGNVYGLLDFPKDLKWNNKNRLMELYDLEDC